MAEIRLQIPDAVAKKLQEQLGGSARLTDIARDALAMFRWAVEEKAKGRLVLSSNDQGEQIKQLVMPSLEEVAPTASPSDEEEADGETGRAVVAAR